MLTSTFWRFFILIFSFTVPFNYGDFWDVFKCLYFVRYVCWASNIASSNNLCCLKHLTFSVTLLNFFLIASLTFSYKLNVTVVDYFAPEGIFDTCTSSLFLPTGLSKGTFWTEMLFLLFLVFWLVSSPKQSFIVCKMPFLQLS